jgi:serine/threonine protein kinase
MCLMGPTIWDKSMCINVTCVLNDVQALADCHRRGLTHGDVKPENIMSVREKNGIKLVDFGTASMSDGWHSFYLLSLHMNVDL